MINILRLTSILILIIAFHIHAQTATLEATFELKDFNGIKVPYQNGMPVPTFEKQNRQILNLQGEWKKQRFTANDDISLKKRDAAGYSQLVAEAANRHLVSFNDSGWESKQIPGVENNLNPAPTPPEIYQDGTWYRKTFQVDGANAEDFAKLIFYAVNYVADVWLNDHYLGYHEGGYTPFAFDVSDKLNYGSSNTIVVRVDNIRWGSRNDIIPPYQSDWFNYGGIIHDVYLEFSDPVSVIRANVVPLDLEGNISVSSTLVNKLNSNANVSAEIKIYEAHVDSNNITSEYSLDLIGTEVIPEGETASQQNITADSISIWQTNLKITSPKIWTPKNPNLYILKVTLKNGDTVLDEYTTQFGIRTVAANGNKFLLNNRVTFLTGLARHEEHPDYGRSVPKEIIFSDLKTVKSLNSNFLRTGHYPNHVYTYLTADRIGLTIMEEIPVWWLDTPDPWLIQNNSRKIHLQMFREMVFKDYNRPSVILWSTSNECKEETNRIIYNQMVVDDIKQNYPDGRLISQSSAGDNPGSKDITQNPLDVAGWTLYFGIFHGSTYYGGTVNFLLQAKNNFPNKPIIDTEFGYWSSENNSTLQKQVEVFNETFKAFKFFATLNQDGTINPNGMLMASTWWCVFDWYQPRTNGYQTMGLISIDRQTVKPVASALSAGYLPYFSSDGVLTGIEEEDHQPSEFKLEQNYPNPFNPSTQIKFTIPSSLPLVNERGRGEVVNLNIYDVLGNKIATLMNEEKVPGNYEVNFNAEGLSSGVYFYTLRFNGTAITKKMLLLR